MNIENPVTLIALVGTGPLATLKMNRQSPAHELCEYRSVLTVEDCRAVRFHEYRLPQTWTGTPKELGLLRAVKARLTPGAPQRCPNVLTEPEQRQEWAEAVRRYEKGTGLLVHTNDPAPSVMYIGPNITIEEAKELLDYITMHAAAGDAFTLSEKVTATLRAIVDTPKSWGSDNTYLETKKA